MIKETTKKIHFLPYYPKKGRVKDTSAVPTVSVFGKDGRIQFPRHAVREMGMESKFVRFYFDPIKKIIGWKVQSEVNHTEMKLWKVCKTHQNGVWQVSIKRMLDEFQMGRTVLKEKYKNIPIQKYREVGMMTPPNDTYFFCELKHEKTDEEEQL